MASRVYLINYTGGSRMNSRSAEFIQWADSGRIVVVQCPLPFNESKFGFREDFGASIE